MTIRVLVRRVPIVFAVGAIVRHRLKETLGFSVLCFSTPVPLNVCLYVRRDSEQERNHFIIGRSSSLISFVQVCDVGIDEWGPVRRFPRGTVT